MLDTMWIMGLRDEFYEAVKAVEQINFSTCSLSSLNVFETTIRYLGGFLAAYDLSGNSALLQKAKELGDMLYVAFDTPNRMPNTRWNFKEAAAGVAQQAPDWILLAEIGSMTLEFTRLSQATGDPKYYDAVNRIMEVLAQQQMDTNLPGMWPVSINARMPNFTEDVGFTIGGMADSTYEYLPKVI
jgi:mannosyl-oligosaccharide alpha-1,2-mannosidase